MDNTGNRFSSSPFTEEDAARKAEEAINKARYGNIAGKPAAVPAASSTELVTRDAFQVKPVAEVKPLVEDAKILAEHATRDGARYVPRAAAQGAKVTLGTAAEALGTPLAVGIAAVDAGSDIVQGVAKKDPVSTTRGFVKGLMATIGGAVGSFIAPGVGTAVGIAGGSAVGDKMVDAMTSTGLTDRSGKPIAIGRHQNMHGGWVEASPAPAAVPKEKPVTTSGITDRSGKPVAVGPHMNMHGVMVDGQGKPIAATKPAPAATTAEQPAAGVAPAPAAASPATVRPTETVHAQNTAPHAAPRRAHTPAQSGRVHEENDPSAMLRAQLKADIELRLKDTDASRAQWNQNVIALENQLIEKRNLSVEDIRKLFKETETGASATVASATGPGHTPGRDAVPAAAAPHK